jgi:hypothetical protein
MRPNERRTSRHERAASVGAEIARIARAKRLAASDHHGERDYQPDGRSQFYPVSYMKLTCHHHGRVGQRGASSNAVVKHIWHLNGSQSEHWHRLANGGFQPFHGMHATARVPFVCPGNGLQHAIEIERRPKPLLQR